MLNIWIISQESATPETAAGAGTRHFYLARALVKQGHDVTLIMAGWHHLLRENLVDTDLPSREVQDGVDIVRLSAGCYKHGHSKKRILNWFVFTLKLIFLNRPSANKPDVIYVSSPPLIPFLGAEFLASRFKAKLIFETRDIWPLTLIKLGGIKETHPFIRFLSWIEKRAYQKADLLIGTAPGMVEHMAAKGGNRECFLPIRNGIVIEDLNQKEALDPAFKGLIPQKGFKLAYCGTIGLANAIDVLIEAAALLKDRADIHILIVGQGRSKNFLAKRARDLGLENIHFLGLLPKTQIQSFLDHVDAGYMGTRNVDLYQFGISATKLPEYMYSGKPLLLSYSGRHDPVEEFSAGLKVQAEDPEALAEVIRQMADMPEAERRQLGQNGRDAAIKAYDYNSQALQLEKALLAENSKVKSVR